ASALESRSRASSSHSIRFWPIRRRPGFLLMGAESPVGRKTNSGPRNLSRAAAAGAAPGPRPRPDASAAQVEHGGHRRHHGGGDPVVDPGAAAFGGQQSGLAKLLQV